MANKNRLEYIRALTGPQLVYLDSLVPRWPTLEIGPGLILQEEAPNQKNVLSVNEGAVLANWSQYPATSEIDMDGNFIGGLIVLEGESTSAITLGYLQDYVANNQSSYISVITPVATGTTNVSSMSLDRVIMEVKQQGEFVTYSGTGEFTPNTAGQSIISIALPFPYETGNQNDNGTASAQTLTKTPVPANCKMATPGGVRTLEVTVDAADLSLHSFGFNITLWTYTPA